MSDKYLKTGDDWDGLADKSMSDGNRFTSGRKLVEKSLFNVGVFAVTEMVPSIISQAGSRAETVLDKHRDQLSKEQIAVLKMTVENRDSFEQQHAVHPSILTERADSGHLWRLRQQLDPSGISFDITSRERRMRDNPDDEESRSGTARPSSG